MNSISDQLSWSSFPGLFRDRSAVDLQKQRKKYSQITKESRISILLLIQFTPYGDPHIIVIITSPSRSELETCNSLNGSSTPWSQKYQRTIVDGIVSIELTRGQATHPPY